jgi:hypothetical protein
MKTKNLASNDDMRPEYDFAGGVRGKYARELREDGYTIRVYNADGTFTETRVLGEKTVVLEPDVSEYFPDSQAVNHALRTLLSLVPEKRKTPVGQRKNPSDRHKTSRRRVTTN